MKIQKEEEYKLSKSDIVERAELAYTFIKEDKFWLYLKSHFVDKVERYNNINRIDDKNVVESYRINKIKRNIYNTLINLIEEIWINDGRKIKEQESK